MAQEVLLMKGNEAIARAAILCGADAYFGYPITPQSEVLETLAELKPWETTGMVVLQAESEVAAINMVYGGAATGKMVWTSSSSPGVSLKQEGISYIAGAELPCLIVNVMRGGPGLGTIQPSQADYFQTTKGGGHGDYRLIALAPASVQEMADFVELGFKLAFKYRNPAIILSDGVIGQMMEKVVLPEQKPRRTEAELIAQCPWAANGKAEERKPNIITSLEMDPQKMEVRNPISTCKPSTRRSRTTRCAMRRYNATTPNISSWHSAHAPASDRKPYRWHAPRASKSACCAPSPCGPSRPKRYRNMPRKSKGCSPSSSTLDK